MKYVTFQEENSNNNDNNAPFSRVFVGEQKVEIKPYFDKIVNRFISPNPATIPTNMVISRAFLKGFQRDEFIPSMIQNRITFLDFDYLIDRLEQNCGYFRILKLFFALMLVCLLSGITFLLIFLFNKYRNRNDYQELLLSFGLGVMLGGGLGFLVFILVLLKYYTNIIRKDLIIENEKITRKGLFWNISGFAQHLNLEIRTTNPLNQF